MTKCIVFGKSANNLNTRKSAVILFVLYREFVRIECSSKDGAI